MSATTGLSSVRHIIAIASGKGGVGKSTVATNLAFALKKMGHKVGLMDADIYGPSQPCLLGNNDQPKGKDGFILPLDRDGIKFISMGAFTQDSRPVIMRAPMAVKAITQFLSGVLWEELDYLLLDLPPGTGDIQLTIAQQVPLAGVVIITTPQKMASEIAKKGLQMFETLNAPILGVIENMSGFTCGHCHEVSSPFKKGGGRNLAQEMNVRFLGELPLDPNIMLSSDEGNNLQAEGNGDTKIAKFFVEIAHKMLESLTISQIQGQKTEPEKIQHDGSLIRVLWKDGSSSEVHVHSLRTQCPCAYCVDENTGKRTLRVEDVPLSIKALNVRPVGRYGITVEFSDGHNKGIFQFSKIKEMANSEEEKSMAL